MSLTATAQMAEQETTFSSTLRRLEELAERLREVDLGLRNALSNLISYDPPDQTGPPQPPSSSIFHRTGDVVEDCHAQVSSIGASVSQLHRYIGIEVAQAGRAVRP